MTKAELAARVAGKVHLVLKGGEDVKSTYQYDLRHRLELRHAVTYLEAHSPETKDNVMLDQSILDDIVRRIVEVAQPKQIILFGSAARGDMNQHSDVDVLVIKENAHRRHLTARIYENLYGVGAPVDVVVVTPSDVERYKDSHALIIKPALQEGRVIYAAA